MKYTLIFLTTFVCILSACDSQELSEDKTKEISKEKALETAIEVTHLDSTHDIITTTYNAWVQNQNIKQIKHSDTIASLGFGKVEGTDEQGNAIEKIAQKDYEIFITVK
jgi:uncharacterized lipoprotein